VGIRSREKELFVSVSFFLPFLPSLFPIALADIYRTSLPSCFLSQLSISRNHTSTHNIVLSAYDTKSSVATSYPLYDTLLPFLGIAGSKLRVSVLYKQGKKDTRSPPRGQIGGVKRWEDVDLERMPDFWLVCDDIFVGYPITSDEYRVRKAEGAQVHSTETQYVDFTGHEKEGKFKIHHSYLRDDYIRKLFFRFSPTKVGRACPLIFRFLFRQSDADPLALFFSVSFEFARDLGEFDATST